MSVRCSQCGEELIGSVNRCWRCGNATVSTPDSHEAPPIRRGPVDLAEVLDENSLLGENRNLDANHREVTIVAELDLGSVSPVQPPASARPAYPKDTLRENFAISGLVAAAMSFIASFASSWAVIPAVIAIWMSYRGVKSSRKKLAIIALVLISLALLIVGVRTVRQLRTYRQLQQQQEMDAFENFGY